MKKVLQKLSYLALLIVLSASTPVFSQTYVTPVVFEDIPNGVTDVAIRVDNFEDMLLMQFPLHYDPTQLELAEISILNLPGLGLGDIEDVIPGLLQTTWLTPDLLFGTTVPDGTHIMTLRFNNLVPDPDCSFLINSIPIDLLFLDLDLLNNTVANACTAANLHGKIYQDVLDICDPLNLTGNTLSGFKVIVNETYETVSQADGTYFFYIQNESDWEMRVVPPNNLWELCDDPLLVTVSDPGQYPVERNMPMKAVEDCPFLKVDLSTPSLEPCETSIYTINYCNEGTTTASNASIEVDFDPSLSVVATSILPTSIVGNTYTFSVGDLGVGACESFTATVSLSCNPLPGQTHCTSATAFPNSSCSTDSAWDGSSLVVNGTCNGNMVEVEVTNEGQNDMDQYRNLIVIEDDIIKHSQNIQLDAGETQTYALPANGSTWRIEAEQDPNHPGDSHPSFTIEACDADNDGIFSLGYVTAFPQDEEDDFASIDCQETEAPTQFNEKKAFPKGYRVDHLIKPNTWIDYHIRFQNDGPETVDNVYIVDTLSSHLDIKSFAFGVSSHPCRVVFRRDGALEFRMPDIQLPSSSVDAVHSQGFIQFRVYQLPDLPDGTVIENKASIYFNPKNPVETQTVFHTVENDYIALLPTGITQTEPEFDGSITPNPVHQVAIIKHNLPVADNLRFRLFDSLGRLRQTQTITEKEFLFHRKNLPSGIYFFQFETNAKSIATGKLLVD